MRIITATLILLFSYLTLADLPAKTAVHTSNAVQSQAVTPECFLVVGVSI